MKRLVLIGALFGGACGATDDRPHTLEYITQTILAPSCAAAECHSAFKQQVGDQFDTVEATRRTLLLNGLLSYPGDVAEPRSSSLIRSMTVGLGSILDPNSNTMVRMPYDAPMPDADIDLIAAWIGDGARGAQCLPDAQGHACLITTDVNATPAQTYHVVACVDNNIGQTIQDCATTPTQQSCVPFAENIQCAAR